ncbi:hypothetical protein [Streptomyces sp. NPDC001500]
MERAGFVGHTGRGGCCPTTTVGGSGPDVTVTWTGQAVRRTEIAAPANTPADAAVDRAGRSSSRDRLDLSCLRFTLYPRNER